MKYLKLFSLILVFVMIAMSVSPAQAQLGGSQKSSFTVQNMGSAPASVQVTFYDANGVATTPNPLIPANGTNPAVPNPFSLAAGSSKEIVVSSVNIPAGSYSVVLSADQPIVATANLLGDGTASGGVSFNGSYSGMDTGATTFYLPSYISNKWGWFSHITVQNTGPTATDVTVNITCDTGLTGTLSKTALAGYSSTTFNLETDVPAGFGGPTPCSGAAVVHSTASPVVAVDNQTLPAKGNTQSYNGVANGFNTLYVPALYVKYYGWDASLNILKQNAGNAAVTVTYSDGGTSSCNLTDAKPGCLLYMPTAHPLTTGQVRNNFGATITSTGSPVLAVVNASTANGQAQTYNAVGTATYTVIAPGVLRSYYGWFSSITCQNISSTPTDLTVSFQNGTPFTSKTTLSQGNTEEFVTEFPMGKQGYTLSEKYTGGVTITANNTSANIACVINHTNKVNQSRNVPGDWSMSTNAFNK